MPKSKKLDPNVHPPKRVRVTLRTNAYGDLYVNAHIPGLGNQSWSAEDLGYTQDTLPAADFRKAILEKLYGQL